MSDQNSSAVVVNDLNVHQLLRSWDFIPVQGHNVQMVPPPVTKIVYDVLGTATAAGKTMMSSGMTSCYREYAAA